MRNHATIVFAGILLLVLLPFACFDASNAPSCTISCATDADCPGDLSCAPDGLCSTGGEVCTTGCTPGEFINCSDATTLQACNATGDGLASTTCTSGCSNQTERCNVCVPDAKSCNGMMLATCATDGTGESMVDCGASGCNAAEERCNACLPDAKSCNGAQLVTCATDGSGESMMDCGVPGCNGVAERCNACVPDDIRCNGSMLATCASDGSGEGMADCGVPGCNATAERCNACVPDELTCASPGLLQRCATDGSANSPLESCQLPCVAGAVVPAHCGYISPKWVENICDTPATLASLTITSTTYTTSTDQICNGGILLQAAGPAICVVRYGTITIPPSSTLTVNGPRALALVTDGDLTISGMINASASGTTNGPGGGTRISGGAASSHVGGGGAGFKTNGAAGGSPSGTGTGGVAGVVLDPLSLNSFVGGPRPPLPGMGFDPYPGGGGGAVLLVSCKGTVAINGLIDAGGGGGSPGQDLVFGGGAVDEFDSATGGGAGGYVVIQGAQVNISSTAQLYSNGGAGGGGTSLADTAGFAGNDGQPSTTNPALGGAGRGTGGSGGNGGRVSVAPTLGVGATYSAGGGGASTGMLQIYTPVGVTPIVNASAMRSPSFETNRTVLTR